MGGLVFCVVTEFLEGEEEGDDYLVEDDRSMLMMRERNLMREAWVR